MRVNRIGLVTSLSLHHHHHHPLHHYYCRQQGIQDWNRNFFFATRGAVVPMKSSHNDSVIFRCFIFQTFYSRPVRFFFLAGTGIVAKNALFVMFWELQSLPVLGRRSYLQPGWKNQIRFPTFGGSRAARWVVKFSLLPKFIRPHAVKEIW